MAKVITFKPGGGVLSTDGSRLGFENLPPINVRASAAITSGHKKRRNRNDLSNNRSLSQSAINSPSPKRRSYERPQPAHLDMDTLKLERKGGQSRISEGIEKQRYKMKNNLRKSD